MEPEKEEGNIEYKTNLIDKSTDRLENIASQQRYRVDEGSGEAIYVLGVSDDGKLVGLDRDEFIETFNNLSIASKKNNYSISIISEKNIERKDNKEDNKKGEFKDDKKVYEVLVRENNEKKIYRFKCGDSRYSR